jgi:hypothetical protein
LSREVTDSVLARTNNPGQWTQKQVNVDARPT